jgi:hypothetical protein
VSVEAPARPQEQEELDALIEEARQRARRRRLGFAAVVIGSLAIAGGLYMGFNGGGEGNPAMRGEPSQGGGAGVSQRSSQSRVAPESRPCSPRGPSLTGDIDGDGVSDLVNMTSRPDQARGCRYGLVVDTGRGARRYSFGNRIPPQTTWPDAPRLNSLIRLDDRSRLEIVVDAMSGASTVFAEVFSIAGGKLVEMRREAQPLGLNRGRAFSYAGSVVNETGVDCFGGAGSGIVVASGATESGRRHLNVTRKFFRVDRTRFHRLRGRTEWIQSRAIRPTDNLAEKYPEFAGRPFPSCSQ